MDPNDDQRKQVEEEQERILDEAMKNIKAQVFHIQNTIDRNQMRQCLRETSQMLVELKTQLLTPKSYYSLYSVVFDEMQYVFNFFKEEASRGRRMKDLYDTVQQSRAIIPRLYLMITTGACYIDTESSAAKEVIFDLLNMVKGVQNPTRGLFTRYYLLKMVKERLPDIGNEFETDKSKLEDTFNFILQNLEEMNRLWIRLSTGSIGIEKLAKEKERNELRVLVGENIVRLASLTGLTLEKYQNEILPKIINIIIESKDQLSQQYLIECIICAFPDEFNIQCMSIILDTTTKLNQNVDVISLLITLMDKIAKYVGNASKDQEHILSGAEKIFALLNETIDKHVTNGLNQPSIDSLKLVELQVAFMKFAIKCCPAKDKLTAINYILNTSNSILTRGVKKLSNEGVSLVRSLLSIPLDCELSLFDMNCYAELMIYLDYSSRTNLSIKIIESLSNKEKLDSTNKVTILLEFIRPLLEDSNDTVESSQSQFEYEQNIVSKILYVVSTNDPIQYIEILSAIVPFFTKGGPKRIKYTLPTVTNSFIHLGYQISSSYENKVNSYSNTDKNGIHMEYITKFDMKSFTGVEFFEKYMEKIHNIIGDMLKLFIQSYPGLGFQLYLNAASQLYSVNRHAKFEDTIFKYLNNCLVVLKEKQVEGKEQTNLLINLIGTLLLMKTLDKERIEQLISEIYQCCVTLVKRADQCQATLACTNLFYFLLEQKEKTSQCLSKGKRFADFSMTNPENLSLFVLLLNKYLYYIEIEKSDEEIVKREDLEDVIETIKNHLQTIKTENQSNQTFLPDIEAYFKASCKTIQKRRTSKKIFQNLDIEF